MSRGASGGSEELTREMWQAFEKAANPAVPEDSGYPAQQNKRRRTSRAPHEQPVGGGFSNYSGGGAPVQIKNDPSGGMPMAAALPGASAEGEQATEITLQVCLHLLQDRSEQLLERPPHITQDVSPYMLFMETPKQKRTAGKWGGLGGGRIDRWANSGGVSGAHDYFPSAKPDACIGVRKRYGRIVRVGLPLLKFFEFTLLRRTHPNEDAVEDKSTVLFQVFSETSRAAPGKRHWETSESREGGVVETRAEVTEAGWARRRKELQRLKDLYERGLLTEPVYEEEQRRALSLPSRAQGAQNAMVHHPTASSGMAPASPQITGQPGSVPPSPGGGSAAAKARASPSSGGAATVVGPLDALLKASTMMLGVDGASIITSAYEETANNDDMWWRAALQWWCIGEDARATQGRSAATAVWRKCLAAFEKMTRNAAPEVQIVYDFVEYFCIQAVLLSFDDPMDIEKYRPRLDYLAQTEHGRRPENSGTIAGMIFACDVIPALHDHGDIARANAGLLKMLDLQMNVVRLETISDEMLKRKHLRSFVWTIAWKDILVLSPDFSWPMLGDDGGLISAAIEGAKEDGTADSLRLTSSGAAAAENTYASYPIAAPLALVWCNLETANAAIDSQLLILKRSLQVSDKQTEALTYVHAGYLWPYVLHLVGRDADAAATLRSLNMSWASVDSTMDHLAATISKSMFRPRGQVGGRYLNSVTYYSIMIKMSYALVAGDTSASASASTSGDGAAGAGAGDTSADGAAGEKGDQEKKAHAVPSAEEVMAEMPTATELLAMGDTGNKHQSGQLNYAACPLVLAEVCEKHKAYDRAIDLASLALPSSTAGGAAAAAPSESESGAAAAAAVAAASGADGSADTRARGCDVRPSVHISASTIMGRCLAKQGKLKEAMEAFEKAIQLAEQYGYRLLQLFGKRQADRQTRRHAGRRLSPPLLSAIEDCALGL